MVSINSGGTIQVLVCQERTVRTQNNPVRLLAERPAHPARVRWPGDDSFLLLINEAQPARCRGPR